MIVTAAGASSSSTDRRSTARWRCSRLTSRSDTTRTFPPARVCQVISERSTPVRKSISRRKSRHLRPLGVVRRQAQHLAADRELDRLGLGRVEHRLAGAGQPEGVLGVDDRERLVEAVDVGARRFRVGRPVGAQPEIAVADREQGAGQAAVVVTEAGLHQPPGVDREALAVDRDLCCRIRAICRRRTRLPEVVDDDVGARRDECLPVAAAVDADHEREVAGVPGGDA